MTKSIVSKRAMLSILVLMFNFSSIYCLFVKINKFSQFNIPAQTCLFARKHLAYQGTFLDSLSRVKDPKKEEMYSRLELSPSVDKTGDEMRKGRNRDLKEAKRNSPFKIVTQPAKYLKHSEEEILAIVTVLNACLAGKERNDLTTEERVGLINWTSFDENAVGKLDNYDEERKSIKSWIQYHVGKGDIKFEGVAWRWDDSRIKRYGKKIKVAVPK